MPLVKIILAVVISLILTGLFWEITKNVIANEILVDIDLFIAEAVFYLRSPLLTQVMFIITFLGSVYFILPNTVLILLHFVRKRRIRTVIYFSVLMLSSTLLNVGLKLAIQRSRPTIDPLIELSTFSFPSGHATTAIVFYSTLAYFLIIRFKKWWQRYLVSFSAITLILLIGFSRIYLGVHFFTDVIAGYISGLLLVLMIFILIKLWAAIKK